MVARGIGIGIVTTKEIFYLAVVVMFVGAKTCREDQAPSAMICSQLPPLQQFGGPPPHWELRGADGSFWLYTQAKAR